MAKVKISRMVQAVRIGRTTAFCTGLAAVLAATLLVFVVASGPAEAAFAGGNGKISFYRSGDVWVMNADGTGATKLTADYNTEGNPVVSPDGSRVAYEFLRGIWVMNADGTEKKRLTDGAVIDQDPAWSADGTRISFSRNGDIWTMNADGSSPANLTGNTSGEFDPAWSPNGDKIAYTRASSIWVMNADGSGQTNLTPEDSMPNCGPGHFHDGASKYPAWSPDGQKIAFTGALICPNTLGHDIWVMDASGGNKTNLINDQATSDLKPAFSPDGQKIIFESGRDTSGGPTELYSMSANGSGMTRLTNTSTSETDADWGVSAPACDVAGSGEISGTPGDEVICGGPSNDTIKGLGGNDVILGGAGNDTLVGAAGNDTLNGGPGVDVASFAGSTGGVEASLVSGFASRAGAKLEGVALVGIENLTGSDLGDALSGSAAVNTLVGGKGADELLGLAGNDKLNSKDDTNRNDSVNGGGGNDRCVTDTKEASIRGCE